MVAPCPSLSVNAPALTALDTGQNLNPPGLDPQANYCYTISAESVSGNESEQSTQVCTATGGAVLPTPTGLTATLLAGPQVRLNWNASAGAVGYRVYRDGSATQVSGVATVTDATVFPNTGYCYAVTSLDGAGQRIAPIGAGLHRHRGGRAAHADRALRRGGDEPEADRPALELIGRRHQLPDLPERRDDPHPVAHGGAGNGYGGGGFDPLLLHHLRREQHGQRIGPIRCGLHHDGCGRSADADGAHRDADRRSAPQDRA